MFSGLRKNLRKLSGPRDFELRRVILSLLEQGKNCRLLDLGCSDGSFTQELGKIIGTTQLYGIEIVEEVIEQAKQKGIEVYKSDLNKPFPIGDESFDVPRKVWNIFTIRTFLLERYIEYYLGGVTL